MSCTMSGPHLWDGLKIHPPEFVNSHMTSCQVPFPKKCTMEERCTKHKFPGRGHITKQKMAAPQRCIHSALYLPCCATDADVRERIPAYTKELIEFANAGVMSAATELDCLRLSVMVWESGECVPCGTDSRVTTETLVKPIKKRKRETTPPPPPEGVVREPEGETPALDDFVPVTLDTTTHTPLQTFVPLKRHSYYTALHQNDPTSFPLSERVFSNREEVHAHGAAFYDLQRWGYNRLRAQWLYEENGAKRISALIVNETYEPRWGRYFCTDDCSARGTIEWQEDLQIHPVPVFLKTCVRATSATVGTGPLSVSPPRVRRPPLSTFTATARVRESSASPSRRTTSAGASAPFRPFWMEEHLVVVGVDDLDHAACNKNMADGLETLASTVVFKVDHADAVEYLGEVDQNLMEAPLAVGHHHGGAHRECGDGRDHGSACVHVGLDEYPSLTVGGVAWDAHPFVFGEYPMYHGELASVACPVGAYELDQFRLGFEDDVFAPCECPCSVMLICSEFVPMPPPNSMTVSWPQEGVHHKLFVCLVVCVANRGSVGVHECEVVHEVGVSGEGECPSTGINVSQT